MKFREFIKNYQQAIVLFVGYLLVASLSFGLGRFSVPSTNAPEIRVEQAFTVPSNYSPNISGAQTDLVKSPTPVSSTCQGQIKGSKSMIYHMPGGAFYNKTTSPIRCFNTEAEARAAGFRKSSK